MKILILIYWILRNLNLKKNERNHFRFFFLSIANLESIERCSNNPCVKGTCKDVTNGFECICEAGYEGQLCNQRKYYFLRKQMA